jgi:hypothetical protein
MHRSGGTVGDACALRRGCLPGGAGTRWDQVRPSGAGRERTCFHVHRAGQRRAMVSARTGMYLPGARSAQRVSERACSAQRVSEGRHTVTRLDTPRLAQ